MRMVALPAVLLCLRTAGCAVLLLRKEPVLPIGQPSMARL